MAYIGKEPAPVALTASDIADDLITSAKLNYSESTLTDQATVTWDASTQDVYCRWKYDYSCTRFNPN